MEEQRLLFGDIVATGDSEWAPSSGLLPLHLQDDPMTLLLDRTLIFNVRGLGKKSKRRDIKEMLKKYRIDFCCIQ
ncbi:hypothetical protein ACS0TY_013882 [Phlomoides rotata]